jgi:hypothetical protein
MKYLLFKIKIKNSLKKIELKKFKVLKKIDE